MMDDYRRSSLVAGMPVLIACAIGACSSDSTGPPLSSGIQLTVFARSSTPAPAPSPSQASDATDGVQAIEIDDVRLVLGGLKLETAGVDDTQDVTFAESRIVPLDLRGHPVLVTDYSPIPAGTYKELEIWVDKLESGNAAEEPLISDFPPLREASIYVQGQVVRPDGRRDPFEFATDADQDLEILLSPFRTIDATEDGVPPAFTVSLVVDVDSWFVDDSGSRLDPLVANDRSAIESRIGDSFDAFEDPDGDGFDDG